MSGEQFEKKAGPTALGCTRISPTGVLFSRSAATLSATLATMPMQREGGRVCRA